MTKAIRFFTIILISIMTFGCATMNTVKQMPADVDAKVKKMQPPSGKSLVYVVRPTFSGKPFSGNISANDVFVGTTQGGFYVYAVLSPGEYKFKVTGHDNDSEIAVHLEADKTYYIYQGVYPGKNRGTTSLMLLDQDDGPKDLQKCVLSNQLGKNIVH
jgi:hypothetical protein